MKKLLTLLSIFILAIGSLSVHAEDGAEGIDCSSQRVSDEETKTLVGDEKQSGTSSVTIEGSSDDKDED
jgi:hypothetical protein